MPYIGADAHNIKGEDGMAEHTATLREKPHHGHALAQIALGATISVLLASPISWEATATIVSNFLSLGSIFNYYTNGINTPTLYVKLMDGSIVGFLVLIECSGIIGVIIFTLLIAPTMGLLGGSLEFKLAWLMLSVAIGLLWNVNRLALVVATAYYFGMRVFTFIHYILAPFIDFLWMVAMWSFGMSFLKRRRGKQ